MLYTALDHDGLTKLYIYSVGGTKYIVGIELSDDYLLKAHSSGNLDATSQLAEIYYNLADGLNGPKNPEKAIEILENILNKELHPNQVFLSFTSLGYSWTIMTRIFKLQKNLTQVN